ncbi:MAG TPA: 50S ribosomal protein L17 [Phycisphaerae bacterium]|nr:50S ribosomal protein L17 [Phycisphaerae bacterium]
MRHKLAGRHLARTSAHSKAMRRNMAQSLFQYGQIETTLPKAKEIRSFVEKLITLARRNTLRSRQLVISMLNDRAVIGREEQDQYDGMSLHQRGRVLANRSGRRHRSGTVPAAYNKKTYPFVAKSVVGLLINDVAPKYKDRTGGYTRIIRLAKRRIGDSTDLAILQLVGSEGEVATAQSKKTVSPRRQRILDRIAILEGKQPKRKPRSKGAKAATGKAPSAPETPAAGDEQADAGT